MEWMILPLKRYADFSGRSRRLEYWMFQLFIVLVYCTLLFVAAIFGAFSEARFTDTQGPGLGVVVPLILAGLFYIAMFIPMISVTVRRLHDRDMSGWLYLISFVPYIGWLILFVLTVLPGTVGENSYGDDPLDPVPADLERIFH